MGFRETVNHSKPYALNPGTLALNPKANLRNKP